MRLPFVAEAADELEKAAAWYEARRRGYGARVTEQVMRAVERAAEYPQSGSLVPDMDPERDVRRFVIRVFPYSVVTALVAGQRAVVAVAHGRRDPLYWRDRLG